MRRADLPADLTAALPDLSRIVVTGANGAGKTVFARRLASAMCPEPEVVHFDALKLTKAWQQRPRDDIEADLDLALAAPRWVAEGGPSLLMPRVLDAADLVIWLNVPGRVRLRRILGRSLRYTGRVRPELPPGNRDGLGPRGLRFAWKSFAASAAFERSIGKRLSGVPSRRLLILAGP